jgi:LmbE family N-acetylglucosaminyl deacetylase
VVAAHPDDEVLGCGGAMVRHAAAGDEVHVVIVAEGITSRYSARAEAPPEQLEALRKDSHEAARIIGIRDISFRGFPDNRLDTIPLLELSQDLEQVIATIQPTRVYTHHPGDLNVDHQQVARAVMIATRPGAGVDVRELYAFEVYSSTEWAFGQFGGPFSPNAFVDITDHLQKKLDAMACYRSELREYPHPRSLDALRAGAMRWGTVAGCAAAEAFAIVRAIEK